MQVVSFLIVLFVLVLRRLPSDFAPPIVAMCSTSSARRRFATIVSPRDCASR